MHIVLTANNNILGNFETLAVISGYDFESHNLYILTKTEIELKILYFRKLKRKI